MSSEFGIMWKPPRWHQTPTGWALLSGGYNSFDRYQTILSEAEARAFASAVLGGMPKSRPLSHDAIAAMEAG